MTNDPQTVTMALPQPRLRDRTPSVTDPTYLALPQVATLHNFLEQNLHHGRVLNPIQRKIKRMLIDFSRDVEMYWVHMLMTALCYTRLERGEIVFNDDDQRLQIQAITTSMEDLDMSSQTVESFLYLHRSLQTWFLEDRDATGRVDKLRHFFVDHREHWLAYNVILPASYRMTLNQVLNWMIEGEADSVYGEILTCIRDHF